MVEVLYCAQDASLTEERYVVLVVFQGVQNGRLVEKAYFYDSAKGDNGGGGPLDFSVDEALERAKRFASANKIEKVLVRAKQP